MRRKSKLVDESLLIELLPGTIKKLHAKFHEQERLMQYYKNQFEIERAKRIQLEEKLLKILPHPKSPVTSRDGQASNHEQVKEVLGGGLNLGASLELASMTKMKPKRKNKKRKVDVNDTSLLKKFTPMNRNGNDLDAHRRAPDSRDEFGHLEYNCICGFSDMLETGLLNHLVVCKWSEKCYRCGFVCKTVPELNMHSKNCPLELEPLTF